MPHIVSLLPIARKVPFDEASLGQQPMSYDSQMGDLPRADSGSFKDSSMPDVSWSKGVGLLPKVVIDKRSRTLCEVYRHHSGLRTVPSGKP